MVSNIYYINTAKVYEIKMMLNNSLAKTREIENEKSRDAEVTGTIDASLGFMKIFNGAAKINARGKLRVILNEGFKKIYGFNSEKKRSKKSATIWEQISVLLPLFPENLKIEHDEIQASLEKYSKDMWWMNERNIETHLDVDALYEYRREEIIESKVIMESMELVNILLRVHDFITKLHGSYCETLVQQYLRQQVESSKR